MNDSAALLEEIFSNQLPPKEEVLKRIDMTMGDPLGFEWMEYVNALPLVDAAQYLDGTEQHVRWSDPFEVFLRMESELRPARDAIREKKQIACRRSILRFIAWTWLIDRPFSEEISREYHTNYKDFGIDILHSICHRYSFVVGEWA